MMKNYYNDRTYCKFTNERCIDGDCRYCKIPFRFNSYKEKNGYSITSVSINTYDNYRE